MDVLVIYAHHNPRSFCRAVLDRFVAGLNEAGLSHETIDLHAIGFNPVLGDADGPNWIDDSVPDDVLGYMDIRQSLIDRAENPLRRLLTRRWIGKKTAREVADALHRLGGPKDVQEQQEKVRQAKALVFIAPVYFVGFPAILKGWIERVFSLGFAFALRPEGWRGDVRGRVPLLSHRKALILNTTIFAEQSYRSDLGPAIKTLVDDFALHYPGIQRVEHEYFYAVVGADAATRQAYLDRAFHLGRTFAD